MRVLQVWFRCIEISNGSIRCDGGNAPVSWRKYPFRMTRTGLPVYRESFSRSRYASTRGRNLCAARLCISSPIFSVEYDSKPKCRSACGIRIGVCVRRRPDCACGNAVTRSDEAESHQNGRDVLGTRPFTERYPVDRGSNMATLDRETSLSNICGHERCVCRCGHAEPKSGNRCERSFIVVLLDAATKLVPCRSAGGEGRCQ